MIITKSNQQLTQKPKNGNIKSTVTNITNVGSIDQLADIVTKYTFNSAQANGLDERAWVSQQVFTLDFDNGYTPEKFLDKCRKLSLIPNVVYSTFSDTPSVRKFRSLFVLDKQIDEYKTAKWVHRGLMKLFEECDPSCKDLCRMYYPGSSIIFKTDELNDHVWFTQFCMAQCANNERFYEKFSSTNDESVLPDKIQKYNWEKAISEIKLLDLFFNQKVRISYEILVRLMTNVQYIYGGENKVLDRMLEINKMGGGQYFPDVSRGIEKYPIEYFRSLRQVKRFKYLPANLESFSPFQEDANFKNLLEVNKLRKGKIEIIKQQHKIDLYDASKIMMFAFRKAMSNQSFKIEYSERDIFTGISKPQIVDCSNLFDPIPEDPIYIFKVTTGAGKSQAFLKEENVLIALPFHLLKVEMSRRMLVQHKVTPETPTFSVDVINQTLNQLRDSGLFTEVSNIIKSISKGKLILEGQNLNITETDKIKATEYLSENKMCREDDTTVLTTHTRAINDLSFKHDTIIFDEDPLGDIVDMDSLEINFADFDGSTYEYFSKSIETFLRSMPTDCVLSLPKFNKPTGFDRFCASVGKGKLIKLIQSSFVYKDSKDMSKVVFCIKKDFPKGKKIFIMSATAPIPIYKKLYGNRVIVVDITNIKPMGVIEQFTKRSFSASQMAKYNTSIYDNMFNKLEGTKVITHLKYISKFDKFSKIDNGYGQMVHHGYYFGNCSGGDRLNGYNVSVVGTPNKPQYVYLFLAELIGLTNSIDTTLSDQEVEWNDFRFRFFTYSNPDLRDIQLSLIEAELLQAAGRSRFLRNNNTTKIFSSLPLKITTQFYDN